MKVCAIVSCYNESDILGETISSLIKEGVDVYVLDNNSTDSCLEIAESYLNKGVIGFEKISFSENGREVYNWAGILTRKELLAKSLGYDWYIHADADEVRVSPWENLTLSEAIARVDQEGFNLINFKLFNFRLFDDALTHELVSHRLTKYSDAEGYNQMQIKAWKAHSEVDLVSHGGHKAMIQNPKVYPMRFILKHYPIRSLEQGVRKINNERKSRFSIDDRKKNWHIQYDHYSVSPESLKSELLWPEKELKCFILKEEQLVIKKEMMFSLKWLDNNADKLNQKRGASFYFNYSKNLYDDCIYSEVEIVEILNELIALLYDDVALFVNLIDSMVDGHYLLRILKLDAALNFLEGYPKLLEHLIKIENV